MKDGIIMISVPATTTAKDIKQICKEFSILNTLLYIMV